MYIAWDKTNVLHVNTEPNLAYCPKCWNYYLTLTSIKKQHRLATRALFRNTMYFFNLLLLSYVAEISAPGEGCLECKFCKLEPLRQRSGELLSPASGGQPFILLCTTENLAWIIMLGQSRSVLEVLSLVRTVYWKLQVIIYKLCLIIVIGDFILFVFQSYWMLSEHDSVQSRTLSTLNKLLNFRWSV